MAAARRALSSLPLPPLGQVSSPSVTNKTMVFSRGAAWLRMGPRASLMPTVSGSSAWPAPQRPVVVLVPKTVRMPMSEFAIGVEPSAWMPPAAGRVWIAYEPFWRS